MHMQKELSDIDGCPINLPVRLCFDALSLRSVFCYKSINYSIAEEPKKTRVNGNQFLGKRHKNRIVICHFLRCSNYCMILDFPVSFAAKILMSFVILKFINESRNSGFEECKSFGVFLGIIYVLMFFCKDGINDFVCLTQTFP